MSNVVTAEIWGIEQWPPITPAAIIGTILITVAVLALLFLLRAWSERRPNGK